MSIINGCLVHEGSLRDVSFHDGIIFMRRFQDGALLVRRFHDGTFSDSCVFR